jgi:hypothetical protein
MPIHKPGCFLKSSNPSTIHDQPRPASTVRPSAAALLELEPEDSKGLGWLMAYLPVNELSQAYAISTART